MSRGQTVMFFTSVEGGPMKASHASREEFEDALRDGFLRSPVSGELVPLAMVAFATVTDFKDFRA